MTETKLRAELQRMQRLNAYELRDKYFELFGENMKADHRTFLIRKIAWRLQAEADGGLPEDVRQRALAIAADSVLRVRVHENALRRHDGIPIERVATTSICPTHDARLPMPGGLIVKEWDGQTHVVRVLACGFSYKDHFYKSLTAVVAAITGKKWNPFVFFRLGDHKKRRAKEEAEAHGEQW